VLDNSWCVEAAIHVAPVPVSKERKRLPCHVSQLAEARRLHAAGDLSQAEKLYRQLLAASPHDADLCHLLGTLERQLGRASVAVDRLRLAITLRADDATMHFNLAGALEDLGQTREAADTYRAALNLSPDFAEALLNLGTLARRCGNLAEAIDCYRRALKAQRDFVPAQFALGLVMQQAGNWQSAADAYRQTLKLDPGHRQAQLNLATVLHSLGDSEAAVTQYQTCLSHDPANPHAHHNLAHVLAELGDVAAAERHYLRALELRPDYAEAHLHLAMHYYRQRRYDDTAEHCRHALQLRPEWPAAHIYLGLAESHARGPDIGVQHLATAARLEPDNLLRQVAAQVSGPPVFQDSRAIDDYRHQLAIRLEELRNSPAKLNPTEIPGSFCKPPFCLAYQGRDDRALKEQFAAIFTRRIQPFPFASARRTGPPRIGLVVTGGHEGVFLRGMAGILQRMQPGRIRATIVCHAAGRKRLERGLASAEVDFLVLPTDFARAVQTLSAANFDVLHYWEVGTDSTNYFLPFYRCAPMQVTSWGWPVTSGNPAIDYFLSSDLLEQHNSDRHYTERLAQLTTLPTCYARPRSDTALATRADFDLPARVPLYVCPQNLIKFHPDFDHFIAGILRADEKGLFLAIAARECFITDALRSRFVKSIPDVAARIHFLPRMPAEQFQQLLRLADVVLDTPHYGGGANTTADVLGQGLPLVTWAGEFHRGRWATACYRRMGMLHAVPATEAEYIQFAVQLANDRPLRHAWSQEIADRNRVLFDDDDSARETIDFWCSVATEARDRLS